MKWLLSPHIVMFAAVISPDDGDRPMRQKALQARRYESPAFPHLNLGRVHERKGQWTEAIDSYKKALALNPSYALAKKALGRLISSLN